MTHVPKSVLMKPAESGTVARTWRETFKMGTQCASATALVQFDSEPQNELDNREAAELLARESAVSKYVADFQEFIDWPKARILVVHRSLDVTVYINVEI